MTNIDSATGLPPLPEGQNWRVYKDFDRFSGQPYVSVQVIERVAFRKRKYLDLGLFDIPFGWREGVDVRIVYEWSVWDPDSVPEGKDRETLIVAPDGKRYLPLDPHKLTPEHIRAAAEYAVLRNQEYEKARDLLGEYPPKSLATDA